MMVWRSILGIALATVTLGGCISAGRAAGSEMQRTEGTLLRKEVEALTAAMVAAFKRDPASVAQYYADDALILGGGSSISGRDQIDEYWGRAKRFTDWQLMVLEVGGGNASPWLHGRSTLTGQGGRTITTEFLGVLRRGKDGQLRYRFDLYTATPTETMKR